jgi:hypothetical protein
MRVITRIAARFLALFVLAAVLVLMAGSSGSMPAHPQLVSNPPSCC